VRVDVARALEVGRGRAEGARVRSAGGDAGRDIVAAKVPDADPVGGPLHGVDATAIVVEAGAVAAGEADCVPHPELSLALM